MGRGEEVGRVEVGRVEVGRVEVGRVKGRLEWTKRKGDTHRITRLMKRDS